MYTEEDQRSANSLVTTSGQLVSDALSNADTNDWTTRRMWVDSMEPTIAMDSPVLTRPSSYVGPGLYCFTYNGDFQVGRVEEEPWGYRIEFDNESREKLLLIRLEDGQYLDTGFDMEVEFEIVEQVFY